MKVLYIRKTLKDINSLKKQLFPIIFLLIMGITISVALSIAKRSLVTTEENFEKQANMADLYFTLSNDCDLESLEILNESKYIDKCIIRKSVEGRIDSVSNKNVRVLSYEMDLNTPLIYEGDFGAGIKDTIINQGFYRLNDEVKLGRTIEVSAGENEILLNISGIFNTPEYLQGVHADFFRSDYAAIIVSEEIFREMSKQNTVCYELLVKKNSIVSDDEVIQYIGSVLGKNSIVDYKASKELHSMETFYNIFIELIFTQCKNILVIFLLGIIFALTVLTLTRLITSQNKSISLLKMLGYGNRQIKIQYFSIGLSIAVFSCILGVIIGRVLSKYIVEYYSAVFDLKNIVLKTNFFDIFSVLAASTLVICLSTYIAVRKLTKIDPIILVKDKISVNMHYENNYRLKKILKGRNAIQKNALRVLAGKKVRFWASILITFMSSMLLFMIFTFIDSDTFMEKEDKSFRQYEGSIVLQNSAGRHEIMDILENYEFVECQLNYEEEINVKSNGNESKLQVIITANEMRGNYVGDINGVGSILISDTGAESLGIKKGDNLSLSIQGKNYILNVTDTFKYYRECLVISPDLLDNPVSVCYNRVHFRMDDSQQKEEIEQFVREEDLFVGLNFQDEFWEQVEDSNKLTFVTFYICIGIIVLLNYFVVLTINNLTFKENQEDIVSMRLLGTSLKAASIVVNKNIIMTYLCTVILVVGIVPLLFTLLQRTFSMPIFYTFGISSLKIVLFVQVILGIMFGMMYLRNIQKIRQLNLTGIRE